VIQARSISLNDPNADCPVPLDTLGRIYRAEAETVPSLVAGIPERTRARLAAFLYSRSHTHELGLKVAATCDESVLKREEGGLGEAIYAQSRQRYARPTHGEVRLAPMKKISLAGSRSVGGLSL
jgi:hypothetical protein